MESSDIEVRVSPRTEAFLSREQIIPPNLSGIETRSSSNSSSRSSPIEAKFFPFTQYIETSAGYWDLYMSEAENNDKKFVENLNGDTNSRVVMISLFSSIVASFIIEIYKTLLPDNSQRTVDLLSQLVINTNTSSSPSTFPAFDNRPFTPPSVAIRINIALFLSFFLSVMSAMACTLNQQWCQDYLNYAYPRATPHERGRIRTYLFQGVERFKLRFMYATDVLLHASIFLFFGAISEFFYTVHPQVGAVSRYCLITSAVVYMALSISPLIFGNSPYSTPLTSPLRASGLLIFYSFRITLRCLRRGHFSPIGHYPFFKGLRFDKLRFLLSESERRAAELEPYAMEWLFTQSDIPEYQVDKLLDALPGYMSSPYTRLDGLKEYLTGDYILRRIKQHLMTCATSLELSISESITRVSRCTDSIWLIFQLGKSTERAFGSNRTQRVQETYIAKMIDNINTLCNRDRVTSEVALRASCTRGLVVKDFLTQINQSDKEMLFGRPFSMVLFPFYTLLFEDDRRDDRRDIVYRLLYYDTSRHPENDVLCGDLLSDGPLVNLTMLAEVVRSRESAPSESLFFCWDVLDILLPQLWIARTEVSQSTLDRFNAVHEKTRNDVPGAEKGSHITRLLEILDVVARGLRLSMVFAGHPQYHSRADLTVGEEHIWDRDLLEAFAYCLPDYIANIPHDKGREFMEGMVRHDDLWKSLQVNLRHARRSKSPAPSELRAFEGCCAVLEVALSALEDSEKVDWRAPEFGSLAQHFESFITHYSQGAFMATTNFRAGIIKAQIFKAVLSQFRDDGDREGTLIFRSKWDATSLALIYTLGMGDRGDAEFLKSHVDWGHIGAEFPPKARRMIDVATRDGPLLIFCQLGYLATTALPPDGSGPRAKDIEKGLELQRNIIEDPRRPLTPASEKVWAELGQLKHQVSDLCSKNTNEDGDYLHRLLKMINDVRSSHAPVSREKGEDGFGEHSADAVFDLGMNPQARSTSLHVPTSCRNASPIPVTTSPGSFDLSDPGPSGVPAPVLKPR